MGRMQNRMAGGNGVRQSTPGTVGEFGDAVAEVADATQDILGVPDGTIRAFQMLTGGLVGVPFTALAGRESLPTVAGRAWINASTGLMEKALQTQRRTVLRTFAVQRQLVGQFVDIGSVLVGSDRSAQVAPADPRPRPDTCECGRAAA
jgi:hypothetical protein